MFSLELMLNAKFNIEFHLEKKEQRASYEEENPNWIKRKKNLHSLCRE